MSCHDIGVTKGPGWGRAWEHRGPAAPQGCTTHNSSRNSPDPQDIGGAVIPA